MALRCERSAAFHGVNVSQKYNPATRIPRSRGVHWSRLGVRIEERLRRGGALDVCAHVLNETALRRLMLVCRPGIRHGMMQDRPEAEAG